MKTKLGLVPEKIEQARSMAAEISAPVQAYIDRHTTATVERATLRLFGADGVDQTDVPIPNLIVDKLRDHLEYGIARYYINGLLHSDFDHDALNTALADGLDLGAIPLADRDTLQAQADKLLAQLHRRIEHNVSTRNNMLEEYRANMRTPMLYVIVATGNIYEDVSQATAAAEAGADVIAVIRSTAQSLLDYVPYGPTTEGFGGTYATQENFRIMRAALDQVSHKERRYIRLVNYCSGLCMPEIAAMGALERLDMMLNDSMYGVLFRDINMYRTFVDQHFSRMINAFAEIIINTGEDNYLTTSDAYEKAHTVLASQLLNEKFALNAGLPHRLIGLGHAFEMNPQLKNGFLYELAQAQMAREIFPDCPLKYMPPTKYMTGDIFSGYAMNTMFNFVSQATHQSIHLLGMLTEAIHTPFMMDRYLAIKNAIYVMNNMKQFYEEIEFRPNGIIVQRAKDVLDDALKLLEQIREMGLFESIANGLFADIKRHKDGGKGFDGVVEKHTSYWNPVEKFLQTHLQL